MKRNELNRKRSHGAAKFLLALFLFVVACGTDPEVTEVAVQPTQVEEATATPAPLQPTSTLASAVTVEATAVVEEPTEEAGVTEEVAPTDAPTDVPPTETPAPPTETPPPPTNTPAPEPERPTETIIELDGAELPLGFSVLEFAAIPRPTGLTFDGQGRMWLTTHSGEVWVVDDTNDDGRADFQQRYSFGFRVPVGVAVHPENGDVYISQESKITIARDTDGDLEADEFESIVSDLPLGLHKNNNIKFGPDGMLYVGVGSTCNACVEADPRAATVMRFDPTTGEGEVLATGLRNVFDFAFHPETGQILASDNGRDDLGQFEPQEEVNLIVEGADYGWPDCWGASNQAGCDGKETATVFFEAHASVNGMTFYTGGGFPRQYRGDLYISNFGSWQYDLQKGIQQVELRPDGDGGFSAEKSWFLRTNENLLPLVEGPDGALYFGTYNINDPSAGAVYRISYGVP